MASEFSRTFAGKHLETDLTIGAHRLMSNLDEALQEVREVVKVVAQPYFEDDGKGGIRYWMTEADVIRACNLFAQLEVK
jgi:hypothetical protein